MTVVMPEGALGVISMPCPSCGSRSLFVPEGGGLTCGNLVCRQPDTAAAVEGLKRDLENAKTLHDQVVEQVHRGRDQYAVQRDLAEKGRARIFELEAQVRGLTDARDTLRTALFATTTTHARALACRRARKDAEAPF